MRSVKKRLYIVEFLVCKLLPTVEVPGLWIKATGAMLIASLSKDGYPYTFSIGNIHFSNRVVSHLLYHPQSPSIGWPS